MAQRTQKIPIDDVRVGMYIADVFDARGALLFSADAAVTEVAQIEQLRRRGVRDVYVDLDRTAAEALPPVRQAADRGPDAAIRRHQQYTRALHEAADDFDATVDAARDVMASARMGRMFTVKPLEYAAIRVIESVKQDPGIMLTLSQIRRSAPDIHTHSVDVCVMVSALCTAMGWDDENVLHAGLGGLLHDIGMMRVPQQLLTKNGRFSRQEQDLMRRHPEYGLELATQKHALAEVSRDLIGQHHERLNGKGYPSGIRGAAIAEVAMAAAVTDVYDALTTAKPYRPRFLPQEALALIFQASDNEFPRPMVEHFTKLLGIYPVGSFVKLDSGEMGVVIRTNHDRLLEPVVMVLFDARSRRLPAPQIRDVAEWNRAREGSQRQRIEGSLNPEMFEVDPGRLMVESLLNAV